MIIKLRKSDLQAAVKEYIQKLFPGIKVMETTYYRQQKGDSVVVEAKVEHNDTNNKGDK